MEQRETVFISYSHDSAEHADRILQLSNRLRGDGIDCEIDQYIDCPPEGWPRWMDRTIARAKFVLMVCTELYFKKVMGVVPQGTGLGVRWEGGLIYQHIYNKDENLKFIPLIYSPPNYSLIPTPVQSATPYVIDTPQGYDDLSLRLRGIQKTVKPPLGKPKPLPAKERVTNVGLYMVNFINSDWWNKAGWTGVVYMHDKYGIDFPSLCFWYKNEEYGKKIFSQWLDRFTKVDQFEELRISIVEGDIKGKEKGYSVYVGGDADKVIKRAEAKGIDIPERYVLVDGRTHRMNPDSNVNLDNFKLGFKHFGRFRIMPIFKINGQFVPHFDLAIEKKEIHFRNAKDIGPKDIDSVVLL